LVDDVWTSTSNLSSIISAAKSKQEVEDVQRQQKSIIELEDYTARLWRESQV
jgi:hypothetical protein